MSKIQEALAKVRHSQGSKPVEKPAAPLAQTAIEKQPVFDQSAYNYGGKLLEFDMERLREVHLTANEDVSKQFANEFRHIKRPIIANARGKATAKVDHGNLVMVASALAGEGKTFTCINLCMSLAREKDLSVVLVDADCAKPHISTLFGIADEPGLLDFLRGDSSDFNDLVMPTNIERLAVLPIGSRDDSAAELLASDRMEQLVKSLSKSSNDRIVVFDSSPLLLTSEAPVLSGMVGQILFVVAAGSTAQHVVTSALDLLDGTKAINFVLNKSISEQDGIAYGYGFDAPD